MNTTVREANDRGYDCLVLEDCVGSYFPDMHEAGLKMIKEQGGIFGWVSHSGKRSGRACIALSYLEAATALSFPVSSLHWHPRHVRVDVSVSISS